MRVPPTTAPVTDIWSAAMACNVGGNNGVQRVCEANGMFNLNHQKNWPSDTNAFFH